LESLDDKLENSIITHKKAMATQAQIAHIQALLFGLGFAVFGSGGGIGAVMFCSVMVRISCFY
jgi:hypothetical protein